MYTADFFFCRLGAKSMDVHKCATSYNTHWCTTYNIRQAERMENALQKALYYMYCAAPGEALCHQGVTRMLCNNPDC